MCEVIHTELNLDDYKKKMCNFIWIYNLDIAQLPLIEKT